jgi:hypothetical protein
MGLISVTLPSDGTTIDAADYNTPITTIVNTINGNISTDNIAASSITNTQVAVAGLNTTKIYNPYKFSVYRLAAQTPGTGNVVQFDTKTFDTGNNVDVTTNKGRFTVPISGFYQFNAQLVFTTSGANQDAGIIINKNGSQLNYGNTAVNMYAGATAPGVTVSIFVQLVAGDYIEVAARGNLPLDVRYTTQNVFSGYLVSTT